MDFVASKPSDWNFIASVHLIIIMAESLATVHIRKILTILFPNSKQATTELQNAVKDNKYQINYLEGARVCGR